MPPRLTVCPQCLRKAPSMRLRGKTLLRHLSTATATTPAPPVHQLTSSPPPIARYPPTQPPSHRPPEARKSQLHRQYTSLLRSSPLILLFQHNNLKSGEWTAIRREVASALRKIDEQAAAAAATSQTPPPTPLAESVKLQIIQSGIFGAALKVVEYFSPDQVARGETIEGHDPGIQSSKEVRRNPTGREEVLTHALSRTAYEAARAQKVTHVLEPLLAGPLMLVSFPTLSTAHLKSILSLLSPSPPTFPAPSRKANPSFYDPAVQGGLQKLLLLGARVEGQVFDLEGTRWVGGIEGGLDGMRGQLIALLQSVGAGVTGVLEGASRSLYFTVEGRRMALEEEQKGGVEEGAQEAANEKPVS